MDFCSLQHLRHRRSTRPRGCRPACVPPAGFGYPLDGLLPPKPYPAYFSRAALLGFALRSVPLSQGIRSVTARKHPPAVSPAVTPGRKAESDPRAAAPGLCPLRESLACGECLVRRSAGCSPGLHPSRASQRQPRTGFRRLSSHALPAGPAEANPPAAPQSLNQLPPDLARISAAAAAKGGARQPS